MDWRGEIAAGIYGASRLALGDAGGVGYINSTLRGFWRSFAAMGIVAPLYASVLLLVYEDSVDILEPVRFFSVHSIGYVVSWFVYPFIMFYLVQAIERERRYFAYIATYNWASVIQNFVYIPLVVIAILGLVPNDLAYFLSFVVKTFVFVYSWFIARAALGVSSPIAAAIAAGDLVLSLMMNAITEAMLRAN